MEKSENIEAKLAGKSSSEWETWKNEKHRATHPRFEFIDQFRGLVVLFLIVAEVTWALSADPPLLDHGFNFHILGNSPVVDYYNWFLSKNYIYTIIDIGSSLFMFILGVTIPISFRGRQAKRGTRSAVGRAFLRFGLFISVGVVSALVDGLSGGSPDYRWAFFMETFPALGWGTLIAAFSTWLVKHPDRRFLIVIVLNVIHASLYMIPQLDSLKWFADPKATWMGEGSFFNYYFIPYNIMSFGSIAIAGTCFWDWFDPDKPIESIRKRHAPVGTWVLIACFITMWFIPFEHYDLTVPQNLLSIGSGYFLLLIFFNFEQVYKYKLPLLTALGRNALLMYILTLLVGGLDALFGFSSLVSNQTIWIGFVWLVVSISIIGTIAWILDRFHLYLRI